MTALVCGDDLTDVAAFQAAHQWGDRDARRTVCALAAVTGETPQPVKEAADTQVRATAGVSARSGGPARRRRRLRRATATARPPGSPCPASLPLNSGLRFSRKALMPSVWSSARERQAEQVALDALTRHDVRVGRGVHRRLAVAHRQRALAGQLLGQLHGLGHELVLGIHGLDEPDAQRLLGADVTARQHEVLGPAVADVARQALRAAEARRDAEVDLGLAELGVLRGQADVAGQRQLAAAAEGEAVDGGDPGLRRRLDGRSSRPGPARAKRRACSAVRSFISAMSAPATNDLSPPPVSTTARTLSSADSSRAAASSRSLVSVLSALSASGRSTVTTATAPSRMTSTAMADPPGWMRGLTVVTLRHERLRPCPRRSARRVVRAARPRRGRPHGGWRGLPPRRR